MVEDNVLDEVIDMALKAFGPKKTKFKGIQRSWKKNIWRTAVYRKEGPQCYVCKSKKQLNAHHIKSWKLYPESRFDVSNGLILCHNCHVNVHRLKVI